MSDHGRQGYVRPASSILSVKKQTKERPVRIMTFEDMPDKNLSRYGLIGSPTAVERMFAPPEAEKKVYLEGTSDEKAEKLFGILTGKKLI